MIKFSIVITAFNRQDCISRSINSANAFLHFDEKSEIIIVDDGSKDDTVNVVEEIIFKNQSKHNIFLVKHLFNKGVCAAKNSGAQAAQGSWIIFLDSDDELIPESYAKVCAAIKDYEIYPIHFFCCFASHQTKDNSFNQTNKINFSQYIQAGTGGEKLPVLKKSVFSQHLYDEDMPGYEGLSYMRIIKKFGYACIHSTVVRKYHTDNVDRLSTKKALWKRSGKLAIGHLRVITEHYKEMGFYFTFLYILRFIRSIFYRGLFCLR